MPSELLQKIEQAAAVGKPAPKDLKPPEMMLYYMLLGVYTRYQCGKITKEEGHDMKKQVYTTYRKFLEEYEQFTEICKLYQQRIREGYIVGGVTIIPKEEESND